MKWKDIGGAVLRIVLIIGIAVTASSGTTTVYTDYREDERTWLVGNHLIEASFRLDDGGRFRFRSIRNNASEYEWVGWEPDPSSPVKLTVDGTELDANTAYSLVSYSFEEITSPAPGRRFAIALSTSAVPGQVRFEAEVYEGQPFVRYRTAYTNGGRMPGLVTKADMLNWTFHDGDDTFRDFFVAQWKPGRQANFEPHETDLTRSNASVEMRTGASADHAAWRALRNSQDEGLVAAWEFDGRAQAHAGHDRDTGTLRLDALVMNLNHPLLPGETFRVPDAFLGVFHGDWDEAGFRTQRFAESVLAAPAPDPEKFPYVMFDTWGYETEIDEAVAMASAQRAAEMGVEVFILDLGWARAIGDWHPDPEKFPDGLLPLSDYVHSLGMKFGLHLPLLQAATNSPVLEEHPDWRAAEPEGSASYFGAVSLCPSHRPARDWIVSEVIRVIQEYGVDWVTQDGENMVKLCDSSEHTHAPGDSNYSNTVDGLDEILKAVQSATPGVVWENCEDGGSLQTFHMIQHYVTSILNDSDDALTTRKAVYGGSYPFPMRYTERYMMSEPDNTYETRSYMFGGPFVLMNQITKWSSSTSSFVKREVAIYKSLRATMRSSKIFHLTPPPDGSFNDAIQAYNAAEDRSILFVYGAERRSAVTFVEPRGLNPQAEYRVSFLEVPYSFLATGLEIMQKGIPVAIRSKTTEIVSIDRQ